MGLLVRCREQCRQITGMLLRLRDALETGPAGRDHRGALQRLAEIVDRLRSGLRALAPPAAGAGQDPARRVLAELGDEIQLALVLEREVRLRLGSPGRP